MGDGDKIRILLADSQALFREAVKVALEGEPDVDVVSEARDGPQAVLAAERSKPNVAVLDAALLNCDGIHAATLIRERVPTCRVIVLAAEEDEEILAQAVEAGANGYLTRESPLADLIEGARAVYRGETVIPPLMLGGLLTRLFHRRRTQDQAIRRLARLTRREKEVLALLADGADNDAIAQALVISPQTARTHVQNVLSKLGTHSRLEAVAFVMQNGILEELLGSNGEEG